VRLSALGDVIHALPAVAALRKALPDARIDWLVEDRFASILESQSVVNRVLIVPRTRWRQALRRPWSWPGLACDVARLIGTLWGGDYDASIDLQGNAKSGLWSLISRARARFGFGADDVREGNNLATNRHVRATAPHRVDRALALVAAVVGESHLAYVPAPTRRGPGDREWVERTLAASGLPSVGFMVVHPGTSGFGSFKRWPADRFGRLARRLSTQGRRVVVTVGPSELALGADVARASGGAAVVIAPPSLTALAELVSRARVFVSADTGPLHIAAAEDVPVVAIFGPKSPSRYGPYRPPAAGPPTGVGVVLVNANVTCRPCLLRRCPDPVCMTSIDVESVVEAVGRAAAAG